MWATPIILLSAAIQGGSDIDMGFEARRKDIPPAFHGRVTAVTGTSIAVQPEGELTISGVRQNLDGTVSRTEYVQDNYQPPRVFKFNKHLLSGADGPSSVLSGHTAADISVGDVVNLSCNRIDGVDYCYELRIYRRPGGRVPPAVQDAGLSVESRWDTRRNAEQLVEEKVFPLFRDLGVWYFR
jgi:hypothetical protein